MKKVILFLGACSACFFVGRYSRFPNPEPVGTNHTEETGQGKPHEKQAGPSLVAKISPAVGTLRGPSSVTVDAASAKRKIKLARLLAQARALSGSKKPEEIDQALDLFSAALNEDSDNIQVLRDFSNFLMMQQDPDTAYPLLKKCHELSPGDEACAGNLATYFSMKNDLEGLNQSSQDCLNGNPNNMLCLSNRGNYYLKTQDYVDALDIFQKMEELDQSSKIHFNMEYIYHELGTSYEGIGNKAMARESYEMACQSGDTYACTLAKELLN